MKIGVCLIGISYINSWKSRDWKTCCINIRETFKDVDYFLTTYQYDKGLKTWYKPEDYHVVDSNVTQREIFIEALDRVKNIDFMICIRFDMYFKKIFIWKFCELIIIC